MVIYWVYVYSPMGKYSPRFQEIIYQKQVNEFEFEALSFKTFVLFPVLMLPSARMMTTLDVSYQLGVFAECSRHALERLQVHDYKYNKQLSLSSGPVVLTAG